MNPRPEDIRLLIEAHQLGLALRGDACVFRTPSNINDDMLPTDHKEFLEQGLYPLVAELGASKIQLELETALQGICTDAYGVFCAHQCFFIEISKEKGGESVLNIDHVKVAPVLARDFLDQAENLHLLEIRPGDKLVDRSYKVTLAGMKILERDHGISWGVTLP